MSIDNIKGFTAAGSERYSVATPGKPDASCESGIKTDDTFRNSGPGSEKLDENQMKKMRELLTGEKTGSNLLWSFKTDKSMVPTPTVDNEGNIYIVSTDDSINSHVYSIDSNGNMKWKQTFETLSPSSPEISPDGKTIYVNGMNGELYTLDREGNKEMVSGNKGICTSSPALAKDGTAYVFATGNLYALTPEGGEKWMFPTNSINNKHPLVVDNDGSIYLFSGNSDSLKSVNSRGRLNWELSFLFGHESIEDFSVKDNTIYSLADRRGDEPGVYLSSYTRHPSFTKLLKEKKPDKTWELNLKGMDSPAFLAVGGPDNTIYVASGNGNLCAVDHEGTIKWNYKTDGSFNGRPAFDNEGNIYVTGKNSSGTFSLHVLDREGKKKWGCDIEEKLSSSIKVFPIFAEKNIDSHVKVTPSGTVLISTARGNVIALKENNIKNMIKEKLSGDDKNQGNVENEKIVIEDDKVIIGGVSLNVKKG